MKRNNTKEKINPMIKEQKKMKNLKFDKYETNEDENIIKKLVIISIVISVLIALIYGVTELLKDDPEITDEVVSGTINYDKVSVGTILNRPYEEYYVLVYDTEDSNAVLYSTLMTKYMQNKNEKDYIKLFYCDLGNTLNEKYYDVNGDKKSNPNAKKTEEFDFSELTLLKIKKGEIVKYIETLDEVKSVLK